LGAADAGVVPHERCPETVLRHIADVTRVSTRSQRCQTLKHDAVRGWWSGEDGDQCRSSKTHEVITYAAVLDSAKDEPMRTERFFFDAVAVRIRRR
jgi:hypothetical protein